MEAKVNFAVVGVFVITLTVAMIAGLLWLGSGKFYRRSFDGYVTYMSESVAGLNVNAPVRYRGVDVGRVRNIALAPDNVEEVKIRLDIEHGTPVKEDTVAMLQSQGLTGIAFVELTAGGKDSAPLRARPDEEYPVIASAPSFMNRLETLVPALLANLTRVSESANALLDDDNRRTVHATLTELEILARNLAASSTNVDRTLASAARAMDSTARAMDNATRVAGQLPQLVQRVERSADAFDRMAAQLAGAGASARRGIDSVSSDVGQFTNETLPEVRALVTELRALTTTLRRVGDEVERNPSVLLHGRPPAKRGPGE
ncbi:MAG: MCE family protein [Burkholderiales bacterium]|nr:MCE family protein [Burkholderiales bacterium]